MKLTTEEANKRMIESGGSLYLQGTAITNASACRKLKQGDYESGKYLYADGILTHIKSKRKVGKYLYYRGKIPGHNVVSDGSLYAHCDKFSSGVSDLAFKAAKDRGANQYRALTLDSAVSAEEAVTMYPIITGACKQGSERFVGTLGALKPTYTVREIIQITDGQYNSGSLRNFFSGGGGSNSK